MEINETFLLKSQVCFVESVLKISFGLAGFWLQSNKTCKKTDTGRLLGISF